MRTPEVDYRKLRLNNLRSDKYHHLLLLLGWVGYFLLYFLTENLIPVESCTPVHCFLDDLVPFCEWFVIPYVSWYFLIVGSLGWFLLYDIRKFRELQTYIIVTQVIAMAVYILFPNRQDLRPEVFPRDNFCTQLLEQLYSFDTNTGVCPSLHVAYSLRVLCKAAFGCGYLCGPSRGALCGMVRVLQEEKITTASAVVFSCQTTGYIIE